MQRVHGRRQRRARHCLPARADTAWRHRRAGCCCQLRARFGADRAYLQRPDLLAQDAATHHQHGHHRRRSAPGLPALNRPQVEAVVVYNSNPVAVAPESAGRAGFAREDLVHRGPGTFSDRHRRLCRLHPTRHHATRALGHPPELRPHRCPAQPARHCATGRVQTQRADFRELALPGMGMGSRNPASRRMTHPCRKGLCGPGRFEQLPQQGFAPVKWPDAPFAQGASPRHRGRCELASERLATRGLDPVPDHVPNHESRGTSERHPLAMISPPARNFQPSFRERAQPAGPGTRTHPGNACRRWPAGIRNGDVVQLNDRAATTVRRSFRRAPAAVVNGLCVGASWAGWNQCEPAHPPAPHRSGRGACFYDCLVQVHPASK